MTRATDVEVGLLEPINSEVVGVTKAARLLGFTDRQVRRWCKDGKLKGAYQFAKDSKWLIPVESLKEIRTDLSNP